MKSKRKYSKTYMVHSCERNVRYNIYYDSYYCAHCDVWEKYGGTNSYQNWPRPEKPSMVTDE